MKRLAVALMALCAAVAVGQTKINPNTQINWPASGTNVTGPLNNTSTAASTWAGPLTVNPVYSQNQSTGLSLPMWGDSLTYGYEGIAAAGLVTTPGSVSSFMRALSGMGVFNEGVGAQTSTQIGVRQGGVSTTATVSGGTIPACTALPCASATVTFTPGYEPVTASGPVNGLTGTISGVHGIVGYTGATGGNYTFTPLQIGPAVSVSSATFVVDRPFASSPQIFSECRNNFESSSAVAQCESDLAAQVATVPAGQACVLNSLINANNSNEWNTGTLYTYITQINTWQAAETRCAYADSWDALIAAYNPNIATDVTDHSRGEVPTSLRAILAYGTLQTTLNSTDTTDTLTWSGVGSISVGNVIVVDAEGMLVTSLSPVTVQRGYSGTQAAHSIGATLTSTDGTHLNANGYAIVARTEWAALQTQKIAQLAVTMNAGAGLLPANTAVWDFGNTSHGYQALSNNPNNSGWANTATGYKALGLNTSGYSNQATGAYALENNTTGFDNSASGYFALMSNTTGNFNAAFGFGAGQSSTTGVRNTYVGLQAGGLNSTGSNNTATGYQALYNNTGSGLTAFGYVALQAATSGSNDTAVGYEALFQMTTGSNNACGGVACLLNITTGSGNTAWGSFAGYNSGTPLQTTSNSTFLGYLSNANADGYTNDTVLGYDTQATASNQSTLGNPNTVQAIINGTQSVQQGVSQASATTLNLSGPYLHVTGTSTINTITPVQACTTTGYDCTVTLIADGLWSTGTSGNIALAVFPSVGQTVNFTYDPAASKWYPSAGVGLSIAGTTSSIGGSALTLNQCATGTATVPGATVGMHVYGITPATDPNGATAQTYDWYGAVTSSNTVTVKVCALVAGTPGATTYSFLVN